VYDPTEPTPLKSRVYLFLFWHVVLVSTAEVTACLPPRSVHCTSVFAPVWP
jgi:hypothetical protein